jgi:hypothetical protein
MNVDGMLHLPKPVRAQAYDAEGKKDSPHNQEDVFAFSARGRPKTETLFG